MKTLLLELVKKLQYVILFLALFLVVICSSGLKVNYSSNIATVKSLRLSNFVNDSDDGNDDIVFVYSFDDVLSYAYNGPVKFYGEMTFYTATCKGCSGKVACSPYPDVTSNVYYNDETYGSIHILAADSRIPCGTIVEIENTSLSDEKIIGIVMDRGSAITNTKFDFLVSDVSVAKKFGKQKSVIYTIDRWGF